MASHLWHATCSTQGMTQEMAFLKYRREVVKAWPESPRKTVFLTAIETRIVSTQQRLRMTASAALHLAHVD